MIDVVLADLPLAHLRGESAVESPNLGLLFIAEYVRKRMPFVRFHYLEPFLTVEQHIGKVAGVKPNVYGLSFTTVTKDQSYRLINHLKNLFPEMIVVVGGTHPTVAPEEVFSMSGADACVMGEGEETFLRLLRNNFKDLEGIEGIAYRGNGGVVVNPPRKPLADIDFFPAWDMVDFNNYEVTVTKKRVAAYVMPNRGCPNRCTFCSNPVWRYGGSWCRKRSPQSVAEEVKYLYGRGLREIFLRSDTFNVDVSWAVEVCKAIRGLGFKDLFFQCNLRADKVTDELADGLASINCWLVHVGIESGNDRVLYGIRKRITVDDVLRSCEVLRKRRVQVYGFFMLYNAWEENGMLCYETSREVDGTLKFALFLLRKKLISYMSWSVATPLMGSDLHDIALRHSVLNTGSKFPMNLPETSIKEMNLRLIKGMAVQGLASLLHRQIGWKSRKRIFRKAQLFLGRV